MCFFLGGWKGPHLILQETVLFSVTCCRTQDCTSRPTKPAILEALDIGFKILSGEVADPGDASEGEENGCDDAEEQPESNQSPSVAGDEGNEGGSSSSTSGSESSPAKPSSSGKQPASKKKASAKAASMPKTKAKQPVEKNKAKAKPQPLDTSNVVAPGYMKHVASRMDKASAAAAKGAPEPAPKRRRK